MPGDPSLRATGYSLPLHPHVWRRKYSTIILPMAKSVATGAGPTGAMVAALRGWSLLVSTLPTYSLSTGFVEASFASLAALLYSENVDTRAAAGEAIALLYDSAGLAQLEGDSGDSGRAGSVTQA